MTATKPPPYAPATDAEWARSVMARLRSLETSTTTRIGDWVVHNADDGTLSATKPGAGTLVLAGDTGDETVTDTRGITATQVTDAITGTPGGLDDISAWLNEQWLKFLTPASPLDWSNLLSQMPDWLMPSSIPLGALTTQDVNQLADPKFDRAIAAASGRWSSDTAVYRTALKSVKVTATGHATMLRSNVIKARAGQVVTVTIHAATSDLVGSGADQLELCVLPYTGTGTDAVAAGTPIVIQHSGVPVGSVSGWAVPPAGAAKGITFTGSWVVTGSYDGVALMFGVTDDATSGSVNWDDAVLTLSATTIPQGWITDLVNDGLQWTNDISTANTWLTQIGQIFDNQVVTPINAYVQQVKDWFANLWTPNAATTALEQARSLRKAQNDDILSDWLHQIYPIGSITDTAATLVGGKRTWWGAYNDNWLLTAQRLGLAPIPPDPTADVGGQVVIAKAAAATADGKAVVADGKAVTADGKAVVADGKAVVADGKAVVADGKAVAADAKAALAQTRLTRKNQNDDIIGDWLHQRFPAGSITDTAATLVGGLRTWWGAVNDNLLLTAQQLGLAPEVADVTADVGTFATNTQTQVVTNESTLATVQAAVDALTMNDASVAGKKYVSSASGAVGTWGSLWTVAATNGNIAPLGDHDLFSMTLAASSTIDLKLTGRYTGGVTLTNQQVVSAVFQDAAKPMASIPNGPRNTFKGRMDTAGNNYVYLRVDYNVVSLGYAVGGVEQTPWATVAGTVPAGALVELYLGSSAGDRNYQVKINGSVVLTHAEVGTSSMLTTFSGGVVVGTAYLSGGMDMLASHGTFNDTFKPARVKQFTLRDTNVAAQTYGTSARWCRHATTGILIPKGVAASVGANVFDTEEYCSPDLHLNTGSIAIATPGRYRLTFGLKVTSAITTPWAWSAIPAGTAYGGLNKTVTGPTTTTYADFGYDTGTKIGITGSFSFNAIGDGGVTEVWSAASAIAGSGNYSIIGDGAGEGTWCTIERIG